MADKKANLKYIVWCLFLFGALGNGLTIHLKGTVIDTVSHPLPGTVVRLLAEDRVDTTDANGEFIITDDSPSNMINFSEAARVQPLITNGVFSFTLSGRTKVSLEVLNTQGRVLSQFARTLEKGMHELPVSSTELITGIYIARVQTGSQRFVAKFYYNAEGVRVRGRVYSGSIAPLAKNTAEDDTLEVSKPGYITKKIPITQYIDSLPDIILTLQTDVASPYYFFAIHNEPVKALDKIAESVSTLNFMADYAAERHIKLTLMISVSTAIFLGKTDPERTQLIKWKSQGHEIGGHHHAPHHPGVWDGFTSQSANDVLVYRESFLQAQIDSGKSTYDGQFDFDYQGDLDSFMDVLDSNLGEKIITGCYNEEKEKRELPDAVLYTTCLGLPTSNSNNPITQNPAFYAAFSQWIAVASFGDIERKAISNSLNKEDENNTELIKIFTRMTLLDNPAGFVFGAVNHSNVEEKDNFVKLLDVISSSDPAGVKSRTVSEIINQQLLPEHSN
ncbi:MAG: T9SS type A sorting domain-containing protein [Fibrobacteria bacterium]|nr:T9SS type A sorting domain-containing protein [Fibrobacteria bacterium]